MTPYYLSGVRAVVIGPRIKERRRDMNLTQQELGRRVGVSKATISLWEKDDTAPTGKNLLSLAKAIGRSPEWITDGREVVTPTRTTPLIAKSDIVAFTAGGRVPVKEAPEQAAAAAKALSSSTATFIYVEDSTGMAPRIAPGDYICIDPDVSPTAGHNPGVWLFVVSGVPLLGTLDHTPSGTVLTFDNRSVGWEPIVVSADDCIGKMVSFTPAWLL